MSQSQSSSDARKGGRGAETGAAAQGQRLALAVFQLWSFAFLLLFFPMELPYRLGSLLNLYTGRQIVVEGLFLLTVAVAVALALAAAALMVLRLVARLVGVERAAATLFYLNLAALVILLVNAWGFYGIKWLKNVLPPYFIMARPLKLGLFLLGVAVGGILCWRTVLMEAARGSIRAAAGRARPVLLVLVLSLPVLGSGAACWGYLVGSDAAAAPVVPEVAAAGGRNIIVVTFDALAAGHTSLYGYGRKTTPNLDALARESHLYRNMFASGNWTSASLSSLMTGRYVAHSYQKIDLFSRPFRQKMSQSLPGLLRAAGYRTVAVVANAGAAKPGSIQVDGFGEQYLYNGDSCSAGGARDTGWLNRVGIHGGWLRSMANDQLFFLHSTGMLDSPGNYATPPELTVRQALQSARQGGAPFFLWLHLYPPHSPYVAGSDFLGRVLSSGDYDTAAEQEKFMGHFDGLAVYGGDQQQPAIEKMAMRYDENVMYGDHALGEFIRGLRELGRMEDSLLVVTADHGEMFEKGYLGHGGPFLYNPVVKVPLLIREPGSAVAARHDFPVSHVDIAPTLLGFAGLKTPSAMVGEAVLGAAPAGRTQAKYVMTFEADRKQGSSGSIAIVRDGFKLISYLGTGRYELFDLERDPSESANLVEREPARFGALRRELSGTLAGLGVQ
ncbi:sulfatase [Geomonas paludis]|uniref:Sulfatase N-terminal domain-containing protein n=1 Tax=Geomonas paludis TaxID=2740185 RepID=A0A6V8MUH6_9BACT|nr:sulfatase [Geomonas paludis]GFO63838.1 hypothetical protein GMPD_17570 [Geomonas paludis]